MGDGAVHYGCFYLRVRPAWFTASYDCGPRGLTLDLCAELPTGGRAVACL